jgi:predicted DNA-binding transcriptional regulator AlpA
MRPRIQRHLPIIGSIGVLSDVTGMSKSNLERAAKEDPSFPRSFKIREGGDRQWVIAEVLDWLSAKAGRQVRTLEDLAA